MNRARANAPPLLAGPLAGLLLYAGLYAAEPAIQPDEPWLLHFRAKGCETHLYRTSTRLNDRVAVYAWRGTLTDPLYAGARMLSLDVDRIPLQIVELATEEAAKKLGALKKDKTFIVAQEKRCVLILRPAQGQAVAAGPAGRVTGYFRERAKELP